MTETFSISGCEYICSVPEELGAVTKLELSHGRVLARTESGITMIVPRPVELPSDSEPAE